MFRRLLPLLVASFALSACSILDRGPDPELVAWLDDYCGLDGLVPQEVRDTFAEESIPEEATEADREPLLAGLIAFEEALVEIETASDGLEPAPDAVGADAVAELQEDLDGWHASITRLIENVPTATEWNLSYYYSLGSDILGELASDSTFVHLEGWSFSTGETRLAMEEAPTCAPAIELIESVY